MALRGRVIGSAAACWRPPSRPPTRRRRLPGTVSRASLNASVVMTSASARLFRLANPERLVGWSRGPRGERIEHDARRVPAREAICHARCAGLQSSWDLGLPDHAAAPVEPSGSGDADVVWTASEVERVGALADRRWVARAPSTHVPVRRHRARLARPGQRRNAARNGRELGRDPADRVPRPPVVQAVSATIGGRRGPRRRGQVERDVSVGRGPGVGSGR